MVDLHPALGTIERAVVVDRDEEVRAGGVGDASPVLERDEDIAVPGRDDLDTSGAEEFGEPHQLVEIDVLLLHREARDARAPRRFDPGDGHDESDERREPGSHSGREDCPA